MNTFTPDAPSTTNLSDMRGWLWQFAYWGSGYVYIRDIPNELSDPLPPVGEEASRDDWPFLIDLNVEGLRPEDVTAAWLTERASEWIDDRNKDIASGAID